MNCSRTQANRRLDFSATSCSMDGAIRAFVQRRGVVSLRAIVKNFSATPEEFTKGRVNDLLDRQAITISRNGLSRRAGYIYHVREGSDIR